MNRLGRTIAVITGLLLLLSAVPAVAGATPTITLKKILGGYDRPLLVTNDGRGGRVIYVVEQPGVISRATRSKGKWVKLGTFLDITDRVYAREPDVPAEPGLLGLAFHPDYHRNGRFYVHYTREKTGPQDLESVISEFRRASASKADKGSERIVMVLDQPRPNHDGGHLAFGPDDLLYLSVGDGGGDSDPDRLSQDLSNPFGSILRIDPAEPVGYRIPGDNPYVGKPGMDEIWLHGLRNPWRFSFDRETGDLWIGDVGQGRREEIDRAKSGKKGRAGRGKNYGWSDCEGSLEMHDDEGDDDGRCEQHDLPVYEYGHAREDGRCSITGGYVHRGPKKKAWRGLYVGGDFCGRLFVLNRKGKEKLDRTVDKQITSFGEDAAGRMFATDWNGGIHKVRFKGKRP